MVVQTIENRNFGIRYIYIRNIFIYISILFLFQQSSLSGDVLPGESYVSGVVMGHVGTLSAQSTFTINLALKHVMHTLVTFATDLAR